MADQQPARRGRDIDYGKPLSEAAVRKGRRRRRVGGQWEELGSLQAEFMIAQGLRPGHRLLDVGCGALRAGIRFVDYLDPCDYYGIDINQTLLDAGYEQELGVVPVAPRSSPGRAQLWCCPAQAISAKTSAAPQAIAIAAMC